MPASHSPPLRGRCPAGQRGVWRRHFKTGSFVAARDFPPGFASFGKRGAFFVPLCCEVSGAKSAPRRPFAGPHRPRVTEPEGEAAVAPPDPRLRTRFPTGAMAGSVVEVLGVGRKERIGSSE